MSATNLQTPQFQTVIRDDETNDLLLTIVTALEAMQDDDDLNAKTLEIIDLLTHIDADLHRIANYFEQGAAPPAG